MKQKKSQSQHGEIAISVEHVSKSFRIPHEQVTSLRGAFVSAFQRNRTYEEFKALDDVSFTVKKGEFFGIIGRNGSGKSTLLKILAGIYRPDSGRVRVNGRISPFLELGIGFNPELSGRDNIYLNATVLGLSKKEIDAKFDKIVAFAELERFIDQKLKNYSSGMQVRLAFAVSIHANRDILLMDEVLAVGDSNFQSKCLEEFTRYKDAGRTVIIVTHDISVVQRYCDRALLLRKGKIEMIGDPEKVGNEYIYQNMSDEERRLHKERLSKQGKVSEGVPGEVVKEDDKSNGCEKLSNSAASIEKVIITDTKGVNKKVFLSNSQMIITLKCRFHKSVRNPNFGIDIKNMQHVSLFAMNTKLSEVSAGIMKAGSRCQVSFLIDNYLASGVYSITAAITTQGDANIDWQNDIAKFRVSAPLETPAVVNLPYRIKIREL